ncbi:prolyl oligopeptidase family serine peptidase [Pelomonas sp. UHG3]|uniref:Prolyl oligopeptidase family serine peptidase n=1 Tax=Roseateles hydrophilus TaxID=2975054 RepID=A0ACC6C6B4_9BURK|nr:prolyl oligopeptidase family serine peptidase [Pelomonas sp. UHG3]MCY4743968.1 prolyl oligopeptidase family serine peptidase [Pelomonas sp. UHG3]
MFRWAACVTVVLLAAGAQAAPPPAEVFFREPDIVDARLSPSGRWLAITGTLGAERAGLVVFDVINGGQPRRVVQFEDGDVTNVHWVNDGRLVFSAVDFSQGSGRGRGAGGLFAVNADGTKRLQLVRRLNTRTVRDPATGGLLDWNHRLLSTLRSRDGVGSEEVLVGRVTVNDERTLTPLWLNTLTGRTRSADFKVPAGTVDLLTDPRGEARVAVARRDDRISAAWRAPGSEDWQPLFEAALGQAPFTPFGVDSAGTLYVTQSRGQDGQRVLARYDFTRRAPEEQPLVVTPGFDFTGQLMTLNDGQLRGVRVVTEAETTVWLTDAMKALQEQVDGLLPGRVNRVTCRQCDRPEMVVLVHSYSDREPGEWWVHRGPLDGGKGWRKVGRAREAVKAEDMAAMAFQRITARDGRDLPVWVTRSPAAKGPLPAVVLVHGGPWSRGNIWGWHAQAQFLASLGYVVIEPEFRGSTGYGEAHMKAGFRQWGQAMQDDVADALRWAQKQGLASDKACIAGASYGGYSTLMGLVRDPALYRCGVAWLAVTDLELLVNGSFWVDDDAHLMRRYRMSELVADGKADAGMILANSPVLQAARLKAPLLLAFGEEDRRVPLAHGKRLREALQAAGNEPQWVTYPGEGHGLAVLKNEVDFAERMAAFLAQHLAPAGSAQAR